MQGKTRTIAPLHGLGASLIQVTATAERGPYVFKLGDVGDPGVREARVRVRAALGQVGVDIADVGCAIRVTLEPEVRFSSGAFDLAIAVAILKALGKVPADLLDGAALLGELSFTGFLRNIRGVLPALRTGLVPEAVVPADSGPEASHAGIEVHTVAYLHDIMTRDLHRVPDPEPFKPTYQHDCDFADIRGLDAAKRAMEIAAAGGHGLLFVGAPGTGRTILARRLPTIMPPLTHGDALEVTSIHSVAGLLHPERGFMSTRPFRAPHHTVSAGGLVGSSLTTCRPGEVSLAHNGVLFLDELDDFKPLALEALWFALDARQAHLISEVDNAVFPAAPLLVSALGPCPCGYRGDCTCSPERIAAYRERVRKLPVYDCFDVQVQLPLADPDAKVAPIGETSEVVRERVVNARRIQDERRLGSPSAKRNAELACGPVLRVARTIADLAGSNKVLDEHIAEAKSLRVMDER